jgi:hypothetical protein
MIIEDVKGVFWKVRDESRVSTGEFAYGEIDLNGPHMLYPNLKRPYV